MVIATTCFATDTVLFAVGINHKWPVMEIMSIILIRWKFKLYIIAGTRIALAGVKPFTAVKDTWDQVNICAAESFPLASHKQKKPSSGIHVTVIITDSRIVYPGRGYEVSDTRRVKPRAPLKKYHVAV